MLAKTNKNTCSGCTACSAVCPKHCIVMKEDEEGFDYPYIEDKSKCINCGLCKQICPVNNDLKKSGNSYTLAVQNLNENIRSKSSAGGIIGAIFEYVFSKQGVAYGAVFDENCLVKHMAVSSMEECLEYKIFSSKYVTSNLDGVFTSVQGDLLKGKLVCFVGLPCQVAGLKAFLKKNYNNLLLVDLTCYGVPSRLFFKKYIMYLEEKYKSKIKDVRFRDKSYGYSAPTMFIEFKDGQIHSQTPAVKSYLRAFFANMSIRPSCYHCAFKGVERVSDLTIGDCKNIKDFISEFDDDKGTTVVYVHSATGEKIINNLNNVRLRKVPIDKILMSCGQKMQKQASYNPKRQGFFSDLSHLPYEKLINKHCPPNYKEYVVNIIKWFLLKTGLNKTSILRKLKGR